ncbi:hypothetical protein I7E32_17885 [Alcaligenes faecalis]|uniref:hypothetical protein n=1 Tax=Alcaligenes faecalis TaxID=511 RepID=UPI001A197BFB|nr:hypothetical protein [Alcaligenes faecalis]MBH0312248.1 hypothetical protein [Alcaligenes faecalis]
MEKYVKKQPSSVKWKAVSSHVLPKLNGSGKPGIKRIKCLFANYLMLETRMTFNACD